MALHGSSSGELDILTLTDEFIKGFTSENIPVLFPIISVDAWRGTRFQFEKDLEKRTVKMSLLGNHLSESYKTIKATFTVTPRDESTVVNNGSCIVWTVEFEKIRHDIEDPVLIVVTLVKYFWAMDNYIYVRFVPNRKIDSIDAKSPADECFKGFIKAFKDDVAVKIEAEDWENRTATITMKRSHILMENYKMLKVTITITLKEDSDGSHVKWAIESEKRSDHIIDPDLHLT